MSSYCSSSSVLLLPRMDFGVWSGPPIESHFCAVCKAFLVMSEPQWRDHDRGHYQMKQLLPETVEYIFQMPHINHTRVVPPVTAVPEPEMFSLTKLRNDTKLHSCPFANCTISFKCNSHLERHIRIHTGERPFNCTICLKSFKRLSHLRRHEMTHKDDRPYTCLECNRDFTTTDALKKHQRLHFGDRSFQCSSCSKAFFSAANLKVHLRTHTGEKPFACSFCPKAMSTAGSLKEHERIHTGQTNRYECLLCNLYFTSSSLLRAHFRTHSPDNGVRALQTCAHCLGDFAMPDEFTAHILHCPPAVSINVL